VAARSVAPHRQSLDMAVKKPKALLPWVESTVEVEETIGGRVKQEPDPTVPSV